MNNQRVSQNPVSHVTHQLCHKPPNSCVTKHPESTHSGRIAHGPIGHIRSLIQRVHRLKPTINGFYTDHQGRNPPVNRGVTPQIDTQIPREVSAL